MNKSLKKTVCVGKEMEFNSEGMAFSSLWPSMDRYSEFGWNVEGDGNNGFPQRKKAERMTAKERVKDWEAE